MTVSRILTCLALTSLLAGAGCGRKSQLETPYDAAIQARNEAEKNDQPLPPEPEKPVEDKPFILDPLL